MSENDSSFLVRVSENMSEVAILHQMFDETRRQNELLQTEIAFLKKQNAEIINLLKKRDNNSKLTKKLVNANSNIPTCLTTVSNRNDVIASETANLPVHVVVAGNDIEYEKNEDIPVNLNTIAAEDPKEMVPNNDNAKHAADWELVVNKKGRPAKESKKRTSNMVFKIVSNGTGLIGVQKQAHLHVYRLHPSSTEMDIEKHLKEAGLNECRIEKLNSKFPEA